MILATQEQAYNDVSYWQQVEIERLIEKSCYDEEQRDAILSTVKTMTSEQASELIQILYNNQLPPFTHSDGGKTGIYNNPLEVIQSRK